MCVCVCGGRRRGWEREKGREKRNILARFSFFFVLAVKVGMLGVVGCDLRT